MRILFLLVLIFLVGGCRGDYSEPALETLSGGSTESVEKAADIVANLTLPSKLDTLKGDRAANQRLRKVCYWLYVSGDPEEVLDVAILSWLLTGA